MGHPTKDLAAPLSCVQAQPSEALAGSVCLRTGAVKDVGEVPSERVAWE
jgi:hypothetical protein